MSITDELREYASGWWDRKCHDRLLAIVDRIDAEHRAALEKLAAQVDRFEPEDRAEPERGVNWKEEARAWERHCKELIVERDEHYIALPVDADGVPIRVGDVMDVGIVFAIGDDGVFMVEKGFSGKYDVECFDGFACHHHAPTVEDVLREFAEKMNENMGMYTGEAIDADEWRDADRQTIAEFAAKLRLAEEVGA